MQWRKFGIEIEGWSGLTREELAPLLQKHTSIPVRVIPWQRASRAPSYWLLTTDGSLRNEILGGKGYEMVSPPLKGEDGMKELKMMVNAMRNKKLLGKENIFKHGQRCSVHIHISIEDMDDTDCRKIYEMYQYLEPQLNRMFPMSRTNNTARSGRSYCAPIAEVPFEIATDPERTNNAKYYSVQFPKAISTIEFRIHSATTNYSKIYQWIKILNQIIDFALKNTAVSRMRKSKDFIDLVNILDDESYAYFEARAKKFDRQKKKAGVLV